MNTIITLPQNRHFYLYLFKITDLMNNKVYFKLGKADDVLKRTNKWKKDFLKLVSCHRNYIDCDTFRFDVVWKKPCWYMTEDCKFKFYMTSGDNPNLSGNDADDIFRKLLKSFKGVDNYKITLFNEFLTDEGVDFHTNNINDIKNILNDTYSYWKTITEEKKVDKSDYFVRVSLHEDKSDEIKEFDSIKYDYQGKAIDDIYEKLSSGNNQDYLAIIPCGAGKTSISMSACARISTDNDYQPILLIAGLNSVFGAFDSDSKKFTYGGKTIKCYNIENISKDIIDDNKKKSIITLIYTTCQSSVKRGGKNIDVYDEKLSERYDEKLSERLLNILDSGIRFSSIITDEAHKIVFGSKMVEIFPKVREYHSNPLNIIHMSGTGYNVIRRYNIPYIEIKDIDVRKAQGDAAVNKHFIVCRNDEFIPYFENNISEGWSYILNENINVKMFNDVDSINCISTIKNGLEKPVIGAYLSGIDVVKKSFDYLTSKYSYEDVLIISANGSYKHKKIGDCFVRNDINGNIRKIKNSYNEIISEVSKFANQGKMVILLNVDKFVESWTIKEMNVQLILRNVGSPDTIGQATSRPTRIYKEFDNVIKKDAYIFLYGNTFTKMVYGLFMDKYDREKIIHKKSCSVEWDRAMNTLFPEGNTIYMDGKVYGYEENHESNLNELRDIVIRDHIRHDKSADALIGTIERILPEHFCKLSEIDVYFKNQIKSNLTNTIKKNVVDGEGNDRNNSGNGSGHNVMNVDNMRTKLKTFIYNLFMVRITVFTFEKDVTFDEIVLNSNEIDESCYNYAVQLSETIKDGYDLFKNIIMDWINEKYSI